MEIDECMWTFVRGHQGVMNYIRTLQRWVKHGRNEKERDDTRKPTFGVIILYTGIIHYTL